MESHLCGRGHAETQFSTSRGRRIRKFHQNSSRPKFPELGRREQRVLPAEMERVLLGSGRARMLSTWRSLGSGRTFSEWRAVRKNQLWTNLYRDPDVTCRGTLE
jgi:hypothetical protein